MIAIDTNVIVRFLVDDDHSQAERAKNLIAAEDTFLATSVLLETEWVLRTAYGLPRQDVCDKLRAFLRLPRVAAQERAAAVAALDWARQGMDFADALHLATSSECEAFASFDRALAKAAARIGAVAVRAP
ncbi:type II toxin-antitoxin system VapC family toxin [Roseiarcus sp.]|uniref:type II toxin-antitoxin system VapC family toxin n=1 Tax=Roseiarcus sp. TaxID=1969460 RepID=UPI003F9C6890